MSRFIFAAVLFICSITSVYGDDKKAAKCQTPELFGQQPYDDLVCSGIAMMDQRDYRRAIEFFEKAIAEPLLDSPNFQLYPLMARAYFEAGDKAKAIEFLKKAELSLMVFTRILSCEETSSGSVIVQNVWGKTYKVDSPYQNEIADRMCGAAYDRTYHPESLTEILGESLMVKNYLDIKRTIEDGK